MNRTKIKELIIGLAKHDLCPVIIDITGLSEDDVNLETNAQPMVDGVIIYCLRKRLWKIYIRFMMLF